VKSFNRQERQGSLTLHTLRWATHATRRGRRFFIVGRDFGALHPPSPDVLQPLLKLWLTRRRDKGRGSEAALENVVAFLTGIAYFSRLEISNKADGGDFWDIIWRLCLFHSGDRNGG
jgi:hypothetical protein